MSQTDLFKTPTKTLPPLKSPKAPYKKKLRRYSSKTKRIKENKGSEGTSDIMLFDTARTQFCMYRVFMDEEIGIDGESQQMLVKSDMDEDCDSSDEIISKGVRKALEALTIAIAKKRA
jgi:hypothetical protein